MKNTETVKKTLKKLTICGIATLMISTALMTTACGGQDIVRQKHCAKIYDAQHISRGSYSPRRKTPVIPKKKKKFTPEDTYKEAWVLWK